MSEAGDAKRVFVVMGVSGSGKSVIASELARTLGGAILDGDYLHPRANVLKMSAGQPLDDEDRAPWLSALCDAAFAMRRTNELSFIVCSALKKRYRDFLRQGIPGLGFIYLKGDEELIGSRMRARKNHFFKPAMLTTQFAALEEPGVDETDVIAVPIGGTIAQVVEAAIARITEGS